MATTSMESFQVQAAVAPATVIAPAQASLPLELSTQFLAVADRFGIPASDIGEYINPGEQLTGFGAGGSESLVMFINHPTLGRIVRKVCAEDLASVPWDPQGTGVMLPPSLKGFQQVSYLQGLPEGASAYFPTVHNVHVARKPLDGGGESRRLVYDQDFLPGAEVSTFVADAQPSPEVVTRLHSEIMRCLAEAIHVHRTTPNTENTIDESYINKIRDRLELSRRAAPQTFGQLLDSEQIIINGTTYPNIRELLAFFSQPQIQAMLEPSVHSLVMGDTNTENVMITKIEALLAAMNQPGPPDFTFEDIGIRFIDPRAIGFRTIGALVVDDRMYDNKPVHNSLGRYDVMHGEHFDIAVDRTASRIARVSLATHSEQPYGAPYRGLAESDYFQQVMDGWGVNTAEFLAKDPNWLLRFTFMMGTHFAAMPPFHFARDESGNVPENVNTQKRAIAIYCQGIKWLTMARDMINGDRRELYGVQLPPIQASNR